MKKLAIIGASYLQLPLILTAKRMGLETHVFAWEKDADGKEEADFFYPISITEKESILEKCIELQVCGICSIASDLATVTVNYVAEQMGLVGNSGECVRKSTNKYHMREAFLKAGLPSPHMVYVQKATSILNVPFRFPVIVKPTDRSGSRGITEIFKDDELMEAVNKAIEESFEKKALIEEFVEGEEYSIEYISYHGHHSFLTITKKYTTGEPHFIETGHLEPAGLKDTLKKKIQEVTERGLDALGVENGASHTELIIDKDGNIKLIEIGARMGGDLIGSDLVFLSTGFDFVRAVIQIAIGEKPKILLGNGKNAAVRYIFNRSDEMLMDKITKEFPDILMKHSILHDDELAVLDSSGRKGYYVVASEDRTIIEKCFA